MTDLTQKYLDKELVNPIPEKLPPDYDEWLDAQQPDEQQLEYMAIDLAESSEDRTITATYENGVLIYIDETTKPVF